MRVLPGWYIESEKEIFNIIRKIANKNNINYKFVMDSKLIDECVSTILMRLVAISEESNGQFTEDELKEFKKLKQK